MKRTIVICDKCGRELLPGEEVVRMDLDLCEDCENDLINIVQLWVDGEKFVVNEEPVKPMSNFQINQEKRRKAIEAKEKADELVFESCEKVLAEINGEKPKRFKVDWDKAISMKQQGYKHSEIAEAVGTTLGTIDNAIYRELKKRGIKYGKN